MAAKKTPGAAAGAKAAKAADDALAAAHMALASALVDPTPRPLFGAASQPGFFTGASAPVKNAAKLCQERGWLEATGQEVGTGKSAKALYRPTREGILAALSRLDAFALTELRATVGRIEATLHAVQSALQPLKAALAVPAPSVAPPTPTPTPTASAASLRQVLRDKYEYLCQLVEYQDRLVELPRLYEKTKEALPGLTVAQFHDELLALSKERKVELHILNEVRSAKHPELGIRLKDNLYYFIFWKDRP